MEIIKSHNEAEILKGCIILMQELTSEFEDYLDFMNIKPEKDEERFCIDCTYSHIVSRLLMSGKKYDKGLHVSDKCKELGVDYSDTIAFEDRRFAKMKSKETTTNERLD